MIASNPSRAYAAPALTVLGSVNKLTLANYFTKPGSTGDTGGSGEMKVPPGK